jgi:hypothetical protein
MQLFVNSLCYFNYHTHDLKIITINDYNCLKIRLINGLFSLDINNITISEKYLSVFTIQKIMTKSQRGYIYTRIIVVISDVETEVCRNNKIFKSSSFLVYFLEYYSNYISTKCW